MKLQFQDDSFVKQALCLKYEFTLKKNVITVKKLVCAPELNIYNIHEVRHAL